MLYLSADSDEGTIVFLGICAQNVEQIKLDNPLVGKMSIIGREGLFFVYVIPQGMDDSPKMRKIRPTLEGVKFAAIGITLEQLDRVAKQETVLTACPGERLPGIKRITVALCEDQKAFVAFLKKRGMIGSNVASVVVPIDISCN